MEKIFNGISISAGIIGGIVIKLIGVKDVLLETLILMMMLDYITGVIKAVYKRRLSSEIGFRGLLKKIIVLMIVCVSNVIQRFMGDNLPIREIVIMFYIANEGISLLENSAEFVPLPDKLKEALLQLRGDDKNYKADSN